MTDSIQDQLRDYAAEVTSQSVPVDLDEIVFSDPPLPPVTQTVGAWPETPTESMGPTRPRSWLVGLVAAAAVVVLLGGLTLLSQVTDPESPVTDPSVASTLTESTPTTVADSDLPVLRSCEAPSTWTRVCDDAAGFEGAVITSVTAGGPGFVAVGVAGAFDDESEGGLAVWTSPDGYAWSRVPHDESVFGGVVATDMLSVTAGGPGLVAVGSDGDDAAVWTSPDGFTWSRVPHDESVFGGDLVQWMSSVTVGGPGLVAVGSDGTRHDDDISDAVAAVWTSPDGFAWSRVPHDESVFGGDGEQEMLGVTVGGPGLVAVGSDGIGAGGLASCCGTADAESDAAAAVWTSPDGFAWSRVPHDESVFGGFGAQQMMSVTAGGPGLVAVGATSGADWPFAADAAVWTSVDGFTWSRVPHDPAVFAVSSPGWPPDAHSQDWMASVIDGRPGLVAVGSAGPVQGLIQEAVWTSPDGITWTLLPRPQHGCYGEMWGVTEGISGLVGVGFADGCVEGIAAVWHD